MWLELDEAGSKGTQHESEQKVETRTREGHGMLSLCVGTSEAF